MYRILISFKKVIITSLVFLNFSSFAQLDLWYEENFNQPTNQWYHSQIKSPEVTKDISNGFLHIIQTVNNAYYTTCSPKIISDKDFRIETKIKFISSEERGGCSILIRGENNSTYFFDINPITKSLWVGSELNGKWETINDYKENTYNINEPKINGLNENNFLIVENKNDFLIFTINGKEVFKKQKSTYFPGLNSIKFIGISTSMKGEVFIDYYKFYQNHPINLVTKEKKGLKRTRLSNNVNSSYSDRMPVISPDGKILYYVRQNDNRNYGGPDKTDIWYSTLINDTIWEPAKCFGKPLNNPDHNSVIATTPDNNSLVLMHQYKSDGSFKSAGLSISHRTSNGWGTPEDIIVKNFYNEGESNEFYMSADKKVILFGMKNKNTYGQNDLYVSFRKDDGSYSEPINLGNQINTSGYELSPFLAADGVTLYFGSDGHYGYGNSDIFVSKRLDDTWTNWSKPLNMGPEINSMYWDGYYTIPASGNYAYVVSNEGGSDDIYRIELSKEFKPEAVALISGKVFDSKTKKPLESTIEYSDLNKNNSPGLASSDPLNGSYKISLTTGNIYQFLAVKNGYYPISENIDLTKLKDYTELNKDLYLTPIEKGSSIRLNNLFFDFNKSDIKKESYPELERLVDLLQKNPTIKIEIAGHTDNVGDQDYNLKLSQQRADAVVSFLKTKKIADDRIKGVGYGKNKPIANNETEEGKAINRRVEFLILDK